MNIVIFILFVVVWCLLFAKLEAEIEGENGWAAALPTARYRWDGETLKYKPFGSKLFEPVDHTTLKGKILIAYIGTLGGKDFTIYHRVVDIIQLFVAHLMVYLCFQGTDSFWALELRSFATLWLIWSVEDTLWFHINPEAAKSEHHREWVIIGKTRFMEKGIFNLFIAGLIVVTLSFYTQQIWAFISHNIIPFLLR